MASKKALARTFTAPPALVSTSLARLEQAMGGRDALVAALVHAPKSKSLDYLLGLVGDPQYATTPIATLCAMGGITAGELIEGYKSGVLHKAQALSTKAIGEHLPAVVEETMRLAMQHEDDCTACQGLGCLTPEPSEADPNPGPIDCPVCGGCGRLRYDGDLEHKKLALSLGKMLDKGAGVNVQVNQQQNNYGGGVAGGTLERMQEAADRILYGGEGAIVLDAEAIEVPEAGQAPEAEG